MNHPISTYRIQFHKDFRFDDLEKVIPYLRGLGVQTIYASPVFTATPGSTHGYDALDPNEINPEVGSLEQLRTIGKSLRAEGMGWLQDIVPNHAAFDHRNPWLWDVLEKGTSSRYARYFDIDWSQGPLMVPFLGASLEEVIENGELSLVVNECGINWKYYEAFYPLSMHSYEELLAASSDHQLLEQWKALQNTTDPEELARQWGTWKEGLLQVISEPGGDGIRKLVAGINNKKTELLRLANTQVFRLCHWHETDSRINYRRFFTVNGLICLNIQDEEVFEEHHRLIRTLVAEGIYTGLRIDHIDGLYNPVAYLHQLREKLGSEPYIVVEKILEPGEELPSNWPVQGNTGYDFLAYVNNLLTYQGSEEAFTQFYYTLVADHRSVAQQVRDKKAAILYHHMGGELDNLERLLFSSGIITENDWAEMRKEDLKTAIAEILIHCPVYRFYGDRLPLDAPEAAQFSDLLEAAKASRPDLIKAFDLLSAVIGHRLLEGSEELKAATLHFYKRLMQYAGPLMAKGVEDTLMYTFHRFIGHNEVGDAPDAFGCTQDEFHSLMKKRQEQWPFSINGTSTHDTKRGEDVRARLNVITELPGEWLKLVSEWQKTNAGLKKGGAPDPNDEYFIYQTIAGSYPFVEEKDYPERLKAYLQKALREAKRHSNWTKPDEAYEEATIGFALALLDRKGPFWTSFQPFFERISDGGMLNSLTQTVLKFTCPGVPDVYQGTELWDLSFVDPDNRRPVDYSHRAQLMEQVSKADSFKELWQERESGSIKLWLTQKLLQLRKSEPLLFSKGDYVPLKATGKYRNHILAFARSYRSKIYVVVVPLHLTHLSKTTGMSLPLIDWDDTKLSLPGEVKGAWSHLFQSSQLEGDGEILVAEILKDSPFAILRNSKKEKERNAGLLLHITSLPSKFGIGDLGPEAYRFADFLYESGQKYWQLLPMNPTEEGQGHSPYSAISSIGGNSLLISPEWLEAQGLLTSEELEQALLPQEGRTLFAGAEANKRQLFQLTWERFRKEEGHPLQGAFRNFVQDEKTWLDDFALYLFLKRKNEGRPWYQWEEGLKQRKREMLERTRIEQAEALDQIRWEQFIFFTQWNELKNYCNSREILLLGDMPIYVAYDSADVWSNQEIFKLDEEGERMGMAGVPPDAFSADGQLWGMPVYRWDVLKERGFDWWIERVRKNRAVFDIIRLDHFRAFAHYWEVPAGAATAREGSWVEGPGSAFFEAMEAALGELPFIAEDLGEINEPVLQLRDRFSLPGMKVLQFAFDAAMPLSDHIPHNYAQNFLAYTGTHDNNTVRGWYRDEADDETKLRVQQYLGRELSEDEIPEALCRLVMASVARTAILPVQDLLGLDGLARMNVPASGEDNWAWRLLPGQLTESDKVRLLQWTVMFNRV